MAKAKSDKEEKEKKIGPMEELEKKYGKGTIIHMSDDTPNEDYKVISTGSIKLDKATGIGGLPLGRLLEIYSEESGGKTTLCSHVIAEANKLGEKGLYIDVEHTYDFKYATQIGVKKSLLSFSQPDYGEMSFDILKTAIKTGDYRVIVLDSITANIPKEQHEGETGHSRMSRLAALMSLEVPKLVPILHDNNCLLLFVNQLRSQMSGYGNPNVPSGGNALKYYASMRISMRKIVEKDNGRIQVIATLVKNKCAPPFGEASLYVNWGSGIDRTAEVLDISIDNGLIEKSGSWYTIKPFGEQFVNEPGLKLQGEDAVIQFLNDNPEELALYEQKVKEVLYG